MAKQFAKRFYNSKMWLQCRNAYRLSKYGICERCKQPNATDVHHKAKLNEFNILDPEVTINFKNLELLCKVCHSQEHQSKYSPLSNGYSFNSSGELVFTSSP